jgi:hypothetical protein
MLSLALMPDVCTPVDIPSMMPDLSGFLPVGGIGCWEVVRPGLRPCGKVL